MDNQTITVELELHEAISLLTALKHLKSSDDWPTQVIAKLIIAIQEVNDNG